MPRSTLKTDAPSRRAVAAITVPIAVAAVAGALALAAPAHAAGSSPTLPFPTSICGTGTPTPSGGGSPTASASPSKSSPSASPKASTSTPAKSSVVKPPAGTPSAKASASPSTSSSAASGGNTAPGGASASPSATASPTSTQGGFWGWLNGVWTFIFGSNTTQSQATPVPLAADATSSTHTTSKAKTNTVTLLGGATPSPSSVLTLPSLPALKPSSPASSKPSSAPSTAKAATPLSTASCVPQSQIKKNAATSIGDTAAEVPWHLSTPSMTMYNLTYNGITTVKTINGSLQALDFTASKVTLVSMITFSYQQGSKLQYVDGGPGQTVTLNNVHLLTTKLTANVLDLLHLTFTPTSPPTTLLGLLQGVTVPLPLLFTDVEADNAFLNTGSIIIPGFHGHGN